MSHTLLDSPVTPYSAVVDVENWIEYLKTLETDAGVQLSIQEAYILLNIARNREDS